MMGSTLSLDITGLHASKVLPPQILQTFAVFPPEETADKCIAVCSGWLWAFAGRWPE